MHLHDSSILRKLSYIDDQKIAKDGMVKASTNEASNQLTQMTNWQKDDTNWEENDAKKLEDRYYDVIIKRVL